MLLVVGLILFIGLVLVHEWGHFVAARRNGVEVEEFGLFFPPRAKVLTRKNGVEYTLNWLPLGGFVKLKGENDADRRPGTFGAASYATKAKILLAGVGMNVLTAFAILTVLALVGMPKLLPNQYSVPGDTKTVRSDVFAGFVAEDSPADKAGIKRGDIVRSITSESGRRQDIRAQADLPKITESLAGQNVTIAYEREGQAKTADTQLLTKQQAEGGKQARGYLGVVPSEYTVQRSTWSAPLVAGGLLAQMTGLTFQGLGTAISSLVQGDTARASEQVSGPVGVFAVMQQGSVFGIEFILLIIAIISLSLAIMNVLPIPALDGGRLFVLTVARLMRKPLSKELEERIHGAGFVFLLALIVLITAVDVKRFF